MGDEMLNWRGRSEEGRGIIPVSLEAADVSAWIRARRQTLPDTRLGRTLVGVAFVLGGLFSFLPVLGIWMLPLGFVILSIDWPFIRRRRRQAEVSLSRWWRGRRAVGT